MPFLTVSEWLAHAEDARMKAEQMVDPGARQTMLNVADGYEKMARHAVEWTRAGLIIDRPTVMARAAGPPAS